MCLETNLRKILGRKWKTQVIMQREIRDLHRSRRVIRLANSGSL
jgi:hypothetical protein